MEPIVSLYILYVPLAQHFPEENYIFILSSQRFVYKIRKIFGYSLTESYKISNESV